MNELYNWHKVKDPVLINENSLKEFEVKTIEVKDKKLCIGRLEDGYFAVGDKCPHAWGSLGKGWCDAKGNVVCPLHRMKFNLRNG